MRNLSTNFVWFQSAPRLNTGGNYRGANWNRLFDVSIRPPAQHRGELGMRAGVECSVSFNPPPGLTPGGTSLGIAKLNQHRVSIRPPAQHRGELSDRRGYTSEIDVSIRPPAQHRGEPDPPGNSGNSQSFNPPPGSTPGGTEHGKSATRFECFNPPPGSTPGGTYGLTIAMFQSAPGNTELKYELILRTRVSIRPPAQHRGEPRIPRLYAWYSGFRSAPRLNTGGNLIPPGNSRKC